MAAPAWDVPGWQPNWQDVELRHTETQEAAATAACQRASSELDTVASEGAWEGNARDELDTAVLDVPGEITDTRAALNRLAAVLLEASVAAEAEQARSRGRAGPVARRAPPGTGREGSTSAPAGESLLRDPE